jgi:hypothetical protein
MDERKTLLEWHYNGSRKLVALELHNTIIEKPHVMIFLGN